MKWMESLWAQIGHIHWLDKEIDVKSMLDDWVDFKEEASAGYLKRIIRRLRKDGRFSLALKIEVITPNVKMREAFVGGEVSSKDVLNSLLSRSTQYSTPRVINSVALVSWLVTPSLGIFQGRVEQPSVQSVVTRLKDTDQQQTEERVACSPVAIPYKARAMKKANLNDEMVANVANLEVSLASALEETDCKGEEGAMEREGGHSFHL
ncbi:unnamed protein product [Cuscuta campestris]|uniref:Uncharacterized protein n=1 Tax=Cuscuta campestris TaxID=132261 RepID=A0A484M402_9ASTE|nr:unnamed protein product [Cuscuta campestris]